MRTSSTSRTSSTRGFTLAELVVTVAVMSIILTVVLYNQSKYTDATALGNQAADLALSLRQAQVYGVSVREVTPGSGNFSAGYGLMIQRNLGYLLFADLDPRNGAYDGPWSCPTGAGNECLQQVVLSNNTSISQLCRIATTGGETCDVGRADITFVRPDTDAHFALYDTSINPMSAAGVSGVRIELQAPTGVTKSVTVYSTGQISTQ